MAKKLLLEIKLAQESEKVPNKQIIDEVYYDLLAGNCVIPWCASILKIIEIIE